ncbi:uncharacterized protein LOC144038722 isoform X4 [Vanacampus margaritifer]
MLGAGIGYLELQTEAGPFGGGTYGRWRSNGNTSRFASNSSGGREEGRANGKRGAGVRFQTATHLLQMSRRRAGSHQPHDACGKRAVDKSRLLIGRVDGERR